MKRTSPAKLPLFLRIGPYVGPTAVGLLLLDRNFLHTNWLIWVSGGIFAVWFIWADLGYNKLVESDRDDHKRRREE